MLIPALECRRMSMEPHAFRTHIAAQVISFTGLYLGAPEGRGKVQDLLKAKEYLDLLIHEASAEAFAQMGSAR